MVCTVTQKPGWIMRTIRLAISFLALTVGGAHAHASLDRASPPAGSTVATAPREVRMWFTEALEARFSAAQLRSSAGAVIAVGRVDPNNPKQVVIMVPALAPGSYRVHWKAVSADTHRIEGDFGFEFKP